MKRIKTTPSTFGKAINSIPMKKIKTTPTSFGKTKKK